MRLRHLKSNFILICCVLFSVSPLAAQKVGYADVEIILWYMPGYLNINDSLEAKKADLQEQLQVKQNYAKTILEQYYIQGKTMAQPQREKIEKQLADLKLEIDQHLQKSESRLEYYRQQMIARYFRQIDSVAPLVAKEYGYRYILNHSNSGQVSNILWGPPADNLIPAFARKLQIELPEQYIEIYRAQSRP